MKLAPLTHSVVVLTVALASSLSNSTTAFAVKPAAPSATPGAIHHVAAGRDAFNRTQADTTSGFVRLLQANPILRARYARHFQMPEEQVVDFVQNALVPYQLPTARTLTTFGVTRTGTIYPVTTHMKKGAKVWATREGMPVLKWVCSNPLVYSLPGTHLVTPSLTDRTAPAQVALHAPEGMTETVGIDAPTITGMPDPAADTVAIAPSLPIFDFGVAGTTVASSNATVDGSGLGEIVDTVGSQTGDLWPALLLPLLFAFNQGDHGMPTLYGQGEIVDTISPGKTTPLQNGPSTSDPGVPGFPGGAVVVPESNSVTLLTLGLCGLMGTVVLVRRKR